MLQTANSPLAAPLRAESATRSSRDTNWSAPQRELLENSNDLPCVEGRSIHYMTEASHAQRAAVKVRPLPGFRESTWHESPQPIGTASALTGVGTSITAAQILSFPAFAGPRSFALPGAWLSDALTTLQSCPADALDEGLQEPSEVARDKAEQLLRQLASHLTDEPDLYAMDECSIAFDWRSPAEASGVLLVVEADGAAVLYSRTRKSKGRIRVNDALDLVGEGALQALRKVGIQ